MPTLEDNLAQAREICCEVKAQTTCSNDIILKTVLPVLTLAMLPEQRKIHGESTMKAYLEYTEAARIARRVLDPEALRTCALPTSSFALAMTKLGMGECQELSTLVLFKLIQKGRQDVAFVMVSGRKPDMIYSEKLWGHCFIILGSDLNRHFSGDFATDLNRIDLLGEDAVVIDPMLNYVGPACHYRRDQAKYFSLFSINEIVAIDIVTPRHVKNSSVLDEESNRLVAYAKRQGIVPYFLAPKEGIPCPETTLLRLLNTGSGLTFSGVRDDEFKVDAVTELHTEREHIAAENLRHRLQAGSYYRGATRTFFVIPQINVGEREGDLPYRIQENIKGSGAK